MKNGIRTKAASFASALVLAAIVAQPAASADQSTYVSVKGGTNFVDEVSSSGLDVDFDAGFAFFGAIGFDTGEISELGKLRLEAEIGYRENNGDSVSFGGQSASLGGDLEQLSFMANVYHDFLPGSQIRPYLGVGIGAVDGDIKVNALGASFASTGTEFAYQAMAGLSFQVNQQWALDAEYRYTGVDAGERLDNHAILVGLRFGF